jgi:hypothetical protein
MVMVARVPSCIAVAVMVGAAACSPSQGQDAPPPYVNLLAGPDEIALHPRLPAPIDIAPPEATCRVTVATPPLLIRLHIAYGKVVPYSSNPPSSGPHYPEWASYGMNDAPVDARYFVHNLEHGAIVLLYKCDQPDGCVDVRAALTRVVDGLPDDPLCDPSVRVRALISPDPDLEAPLAAVAWGWTYEAACLDEASLTAFAHDHYGQGDEANCENAY